MMPTMQIFRNAYSGFSRPAWMLAVMVLINRSGAMVMPFLAVYVTEVLHYNLSQAGFILSIYGLGSVCASFLGGWLTDKFGHFRVQLISQVAGGCLYFLILQLQQFEYVAAGVFILSLVNDTLRPANAAAVAHFATTETMTRAFSLNRMSVNVGFIVGTALGGVLAAVSFKWIFIANGITGILAGIFFFWYFLGIQGAPPAPKLAQQQKQPFPAAAPSPYRDITFLLFVLLCCCFASIFYQLFSTLPLYYKQAYQLSEEHIGFLMSFNGLVVLSVEMVLIYLLAKYVKKAVMIIAGVLLLGISFILFNMVQHTSVLVIAMLLFSLSEILAMPLMSTLTAERSGIHNRGAYMGLFTIAYTAPLVIAPYLGTTIASLYGFTTLWWATGGLSVITAGGLYIVVQQMEKQKSVQQTAIPELEKVVPAV
ncbi:MFS transporter [Pontibacter diazotrophicus]|uniref:MFS transporter n=1 Tax=Pontibacter diazotrophicus TaxID=1400979 RepID=A0A3D8L7U1_9BACT|nr:MFS transporter [Pontibacter diazotrophicus]RDV13427.1 MFS transporter [Pontibacter diazotrophicus]